MKITTTKKTEMPQLRFVALQIISLVTHRDAILLGFLCTLHLHHVFTKKFFHSLDTPKHTAQHNFITVTHCICHTFQIIKQN